MAGSEGSDDLGHVMANTQLPVIPLTASQNDTVVLTAIRKGAQDCLVKGSLESDQIRRAIRCAIERHRQHPESPRKSARQAQERQRESDHLQAFCLQIQTPVYNQAHGAIPLRDSSAQVYSGMVAKYADALDQALVVRAYKTDNGLSQTLQALAAELDSLSAGPRDVIDIHF